MIVDFMRYRRITTRTVYILSLCAADTMIAQHVEVGTGDAGSSILVTPAVPPQNAQHRVERIEDILPESLPVTLHPAPFSLILPDGHVAGSVVYSNGSRVALGGATYEIANATATNFFLRAAGDIMAGPFAYRDGAQIRVGVQTYALKTAASFIRCKLALSEVPMPKVRLALVPLRGEATARLARLQAAYAQIKLETDWETAPRQFSGPTVRGPPGYRRDADVERSAADVARTEAAADGRARQAFEHFQGCSGARVATVLKQADFTFWDLAPGCYAVCVIADVRAAAEARALHSMPLVWWATACLSERECAFVSLEQKQGRDWRTLFNR